MKYLLLMALLAVGCHRVVDAPVAEIAPAPVSATDVSASRERAITPESSRAVATTPEGETVTAEMRFYVRLGRDGADDPRVVRIDDHECGEVAVVTVPPMPTESTVFEVEKIDEIDDGGRRLRTWYAPTDIFVTGIDGDRIGVEYSNRKAYWIDPSGALYARSGRGHSAAERVACPVGVPGIGSDFLECLRLSDATTNEPRLVAYQRPCS